MIRLASGYGSGRSNTPYTTLKIAVVAPMPNASVPTMIAGTPGFLPSARAAYRKSCHSPAMFTPLRRLCSPSYGSEVHTFRKTHEGLMYRATARLTAPDMFLGPAIVERTRDTYSSRRACNERYCPDEVREGGADVSPLCITPSFITKLT